MISKKSKIFVAGHRGLVGSAILSKLKKEGYKNLITITRKKLNFLNKKKTFKFLKKHKPKLVIIAAAKVGGILANSKDIINFLYENIEIQNNLIMGSYKNGIKNLIFMGSTCIYPKTSKTPIKEKNFLQGPFESTNEGYAIAKSVGVKLCEYLKKIKKVNYKCLMPTNLYGVNDNYNLETSHVIPALIKKIILAKKKNKKNFIVWGNGKVKRDFMHSDDLADACVFYMNKKINQNIINIGTGKSISIGALAKKIMKILNYRGKIVFDKTKPNGMIDKSLDVSLSKKYGWRYKINLDQGLKNVCEVMLKKIN